jgi:hypothetical protein
MKRFGNGPRIRVRLGSSPKLSGRLYRRLYHKFGDRLDYRVYRRLGSRT